MAMKMLPLTFTSNYFKAKLILRRGISTWTDIDVGLYES